MSDRWFKCPKCGAETREKFDAIDWYGGMANRREQYLGRSTKDGFKTPEQLGAETRERVSEREIFFNS